MPTRRRTILFGITTLTTASLLGRVADATVWNGTELRRALATLAPGSRIVMKPGAYGDCGAFPVVHDGLQLLAETEGCEVHDQLLVLAANVVLDGLRLRSPTSVHAPGTIVRNCDISANVGNRDMLHVDSAATGAEVTGCLFHDATADARGCLSIGQGQRSSLVRAAAHVHGNRFVNVRAGSQETLYMKSGGNLIEDNDAQDANNFTSRCGSGNVIQNNRLTNSFGIVIQDDGNAVRDNVVTSPVGAHGIFIMAGDAPYTSNVQGIHAQAYNTEVSGNTGPLMIGKQYRSSYTYPALNTHVTNHTGPITRMHDQGTTITSGSGASAGTKRPRPSGSSVPTTPSPTTPTTPTTPPTVAPAPSPGSA